MSKIQFVETTPEDLVKLIAAEVAKQTQSKPQAPKNEDEDLMTREQVKDFLGCSYVTLHSHVNKGRFKKYSLGSRSYFKRSEIMDSINKSQQPL
jgi:predicted DNA-binding transcriptional regulator AlpA